MIIILLSRLYDLICNFHQILRTTIILNHNTIIIIFSMGSHLFSHHNDAALQTYHMPSLYKYLNCANQIPQSRTGASHTVWLRARRVGFVFNLLVTSPVQDRNCYHGSNPSALPSISEFRYHITVVILFTEPLGGNQNINQFALQT